MIDHLRLTNTHREDHVHAVLRHGFEFSPRATDGDTLAEMAWVRYDDDQELGVFVAGGGGEEDVCAGTVGIGGERVGRGVGEGHSQSIVEIKLHALITRNVEVGTDGVGMVDDFLSGSVV